MFKKLKKIASLFDKLDLLLFEIKGLIDEFMKAYEDGKITPEEATSFLISLIQRIRKIFPNF